MIWNKSWIQSTACHSDYAKKKEKPFSLGGNAEVMDAVNVNGLRMMRERSYWDISREVFFFIFF